MRDRETESPGRRRIITKDGKPVAALVDAALFERIRAMQERFDALCDRLAKAYEGVPEVAGMAEIGRASAAARKASAAQWRSAGRLPPLAPAAESPSRRRPAAATAGKPSKAKARSTSAR